MKEFNKKTRSPWAATPAMIKVEETGQNEQSSSPAKNIENLNKCQTAEWCYNSHQQAPFLLHTTATSGHGSWCMYYSSKVDFALQNTVVSYKSEDFSLKWEPPTCSHPHLLFFEGVQSRHLSF